MQDKKPNFELPDFTHKGWDRLLLDIKLSGEIEKITKEHCNGDKRAIEIFNKTFFG